jgi:hypothetical protein
MRGGDRQPALLPTLDPEPAMTEFRESSQEAYYS